ncbi:MAG: hypothetical protein Q4F18_00630, partial [Clostridia bacterium]|nr:hypothetical protein [Clostridia bacterium]
DALQLGVEFPMPVDDGAKTVLEYSQEYDSFDKAYDDLHSPLVCVDETMGLNLTKLEARKSGENMYEIVIEYKNHSELFSIIMSTLNDETTLAALEDESDTLQTTIGEIIVWQSSDECRGIAVENGYLFRIRGEMKYDRFIDICKNLKFFN